MQNQLSSSQLQAYTDLFQLAPSRAQRRMIQIVDAAIKNYAKLGIDRTTYESIAKTCKISRPLILHYFKSKEAIFEMAIRYIRSRFQRIAIEAFMKKQTPEEKLEAYVDATFLWIREYPQHVDVWKLFFYYTGLDPKLRKLNTDLVNVGHQRITALLEEGKAKGVFADGDLVRRAKTIQVVITGALVTASTEELYTDFEQFRKDVVAEILKIATRG